MQYRREGTLPDIGDEPDSSVLPNEQGPARRRPQAAGTGVPFLMHRPPGVGEVLCGRYHLLAEIGRGGSAVVFQAVDGALDQPVAVKMLLTDGLAQAMRAQGEILGLRDEALAAMRLSHPQILRVYNYERHGPWEFLVMEFVPGEHLGGHLRRRRERRFTPLETANLGLACLEALAYAHAAGVIHNDIKPANVLLTHDGFVKLCDFGLAQVEAALVTGPVGCVIGTPAFMSPERVRAESGDARSDLYSLAATLWSVGNGVAPFGTDDGAMLRHLRDELPESPYLPRPLHDVLAVAMNKDPSRRYASAEEMHDALAAVVDELPRQPAPSGRSAGLGRAPSPEVVAARAPSIDAILIDVDEAGTEATNHDAVAPVATDDMTPVVAMRLRSAYGGEHDVARFLIDRLPVRNVDYAAFVAATAATAPEHWLGGRPPPGQDDHPVVGVTLDDARRYAAWRGRRLPTSLEWEAAARGPENQRFPWGDVWDPVRATSPELGLDGTTPVTAHKDGASPCGALDLVGNAWEWTETPTAEGHAPEAGFAWVLGGSFKHPISAEGIPRNAVADAKAYGCLGFRCALDAPEEQ
jgi:tRNA A-37 threonylcarbamoyl transferase component Bud32